MDSWRDMPEFEFVGIDEVDDPDPCPDCGCVPCCGPLCDSYGKRIYVYDPEKRILVS